MDVERPKASRIQTILGSQRSTVQEQKYVWSPNLHSTVRLYYGVKYAGVVQTLGLTFEAAAPSTET